MSERVNIFSGPNAPEGIQLANPGDVFIQVVEGSPDVGNLFYKGQGELGTGWVELQLGGGSAGVGGTDGQIQFNHSGSFAGAKFSSVTPTTGVITWDDGSGDVITLNPNNNSYGPSLQFNSGVGFSEIAGQGVFLSGGAKITQFNNSSTAVNQFTLQTEFNIPDPVVSQYAAVIINASSSLTNSLDALRSVATFTDNTGVGTFARGGILQAELLGSNVAGDSAYGAAVYVINDAGSGNPSELTGLVVIPLDNFGSSAVTQTGVHIQDQARNSQASSINAALLIDDQTAGANVYAIKTGIGPVFFGDGLTITPTGATGLTIHGDAFNDSVFNGFSTSGGGFTMNTSDTGLNGTFSAIQSMAALIDTSGTGAAAIAGDFIAGFNGSATNVAGDSVFGIRALAESGAPALSGAPAEVTAIFVRQGTVDNVAAVIQTGIHIADQGGSAVQASSINAALLIDDQTPGATVLSIKTGLGDISFGNVGGNFGIFGAVPAAQQTITGAKLPSDVVLANLLTALAAYGLLIDSSI